MWYANKLVNGLNLSSCSGPTEAQHSHLNVVCVGVAFALFGAVPAQAGAFNEPRQVLVRYDDLNVASAAGAAVLLTRIENASREVCGPAPDNRDMRMRQAFNACTQKAIDQAVASLPFNVVGEEP